MNLMDDHGEKIKLYSDHIAKSTDKNANDKWSFKFDMGDFDALTKLSAVLKFGAEGADKRKQQLTRFALKNDIGVVLKFKCNTSDETKVGQTKDQLEKEIWPLIKKNMITLDRHAEDLLKNITVTFTTLKKNIYISISYNEKEVVDFV